jgi:cell division protein ZapD
VSATLCYEHPLNERIRLLLRLEFLFEKVNQTAVSDSIWESLAALQGLFEILGMAGRNEFRSDFLRELERHAAMLERLRRSAQVDSQLLDAVLQEISLTIEGLRGLNHMALEALRRNEFLSAVRQRSAVPGGICQFDLPALHYWLQQDSSVRIRHLNDWLEPLQPLQLAIDLLLKLVRDSAEPREVVAARSFFQQTLDSHSPNQLVRVWLPTEVGAFPEISGGRHRFTIRFMEQPDPNQRAGQSKADIRFWLACCVF